MTKNNFTFCAKFFDGTEQDLTIDIATPQNTPSLNGIKGIEMYSEFGDFITRIQSSQLITLTEIQKQDDDFANYMKIPKEDLAQNGYSTYFSDLEWYKIKTLELQANDIPSKIAIEIYKYIVETILSTFGYGQNKTNDNGEKIWYSVQNYKDVVYEYLKVYSEGYDNFLMLSPSQIQAISQELVKGMMQETLLRETEILLTKLSQPF
jgi:hypothetical protein